MSTIPPKKPPLKILKPMGVYSSAWRETISSEKVQGSVATRFADALRERGWNTKVKKSGILGDCIYTIESIGVPNLTFKITEKQVKNLRIFQAKCKQYIHRADGLISQRRKIEFDKKFEGMQIEELPVIDETDIIEFTNVLKKDDETASMIRALSSSDVVDHRVLIRFQYLLKIRDIVRNKFRTVGSEPESETEPAPISEPGIFRRIWNLFVGFFFRIPDPDPVSGSGRQDSDSDSFENSSESDSSGSESAPEEPAPKGRAVRKKMCYTYDISKLNSSNTSHACGICLNALDNEALCNVVIVSGCTHAFHRNCLTVYKTSDEIQAKCIQEIKDYPSWRFVYNIDDTREEFENFLEKLFIRDYTETCPLCRLTSPDCPTKSTHDDLQRNSNHQSFELVGSDLF